MLRNPRFILYKCIQQIVTFNIEDYTFFLNDKSSVREIVNLYYDAYKKIGFHKLFYSVSKM